MNEAAAFEYIEIAINNWDGPGCREIARQARAELANARKLLEAAELALKQMCNTVAPCNEFTDAVDELDATIAACRASAGKNQNA